MANRELLLQWREALNRAAGFIRNGVALGFIRMPDLRSDPAHETPKLIDAAIASMTAVIEQPQPQSSVHSAASPCWHGSQIVGRAGASAAPCTVCGKPEDKHGSYPTCSGHPYTSTFECGAVGVYSASKGFVGLPCPGAACRNGCVVAARQAALHPQARGASTVSPARTVDGQMNKETPHD